MESKLEVLLISLSENLTSRGCMIKIWVNKMIYYFSVLFDRLFISCCCQPQVSYSSPPLLLSFFCLI